MRKLAIGIIAAGTLVAAAPAMAQVYLEGPGVGVRVGPEPYYRDHDRWDRRCTTTAMRGVSAIAGR